MPGTPAVDITQMIKSNEEHQVPLYSAEGSVVSWASIINARFTEKEFQPALVHNYHAQKFGAVYYGEEKYKINFEFTFQFNDSDLAVTFIPLKFLPKGVKFTKFSVTPEKPCRWYMFPISNGKAVAIHYDAWTRNRNIPSQCLHKASTKAGDCGRRILTINNEVIGIHSGTFGENISNYFIGFTPDMLDWVVNPLSLPQ